MKQEDNRQKRVINDQELDHFFKSNLENYQVQPSQDNWTKIKRWSFLGTLYAVRKSQVFQIAATMLLFLSLSTLFIKYPADVQSVVVITPPSITPAIPTIEPIAETEQVQTDFVLDIEEDEIDTDVRKEIIDKEIDDYLAFLFEDEAEFADNIDSLEISKSLAPAEQLPIDEMFAVIPELPHSEEITILAPLETRITLPHRFVAEGENIEDYLLLYEINQHRD